MLNFYIYTLSNPVTEAIEYVGCTMLISTRISQHNRKWVLKGQQPRVFEVIDSTESPIEARHLETYWIGQLKAWGFDLINSNSKRPYTLYKNHPIHKTA